MWVKCRCAAERKAERILSASEITGAFRKLDFKGFITRGKPQAVVDAYECALEYVENFDKIKTAGKQHCPFRASGVGKTHLLTALSNYVMRQMQTPVLYFPFVEGFTDLKMILICLMKSLAV